MKSLSNSIFSSKKIENSSKVFGGVALTSVGNTCVLSTGTCGHVHHDNDKKDPDPEVEA